jgi:DNA polymerase
MWCKVHYPEEFICSSLTYGTDTKEKKTDLIEEAIRLGLDVRPPKIGKSKAKTWVVEDGILYTPFIEIKGFGEKTAEGAEKKFVTLTKRFQNIIVKIGGEKDEPIDDDEAERIQKYFSFSYSKDPSRKIKPIIDRLGIKLSRVKDIDFQKGSDYKYYLGAITEMKFSYKKSIGSASNKDSNVGGVYGNFKDDSDFCMMIFEHSIYKQKKHTIEHCVDKFLLSYSSAPKQKTAHIRCDKAWFDDELIAGEVEGLDVALAKQRRFKNPKLLECEKCPLRQECSGPVMPETGKFNIMIIGEAPGRDEDANKKPFQGRAAKILFDEIERSGLRRKLFNITNVVKCFPSKTKTPTKTHINKCSRWLNEEIEKINPYIILALGNTNIKFFTGEESGIMSKSGTTEWSQEHNCWICWCIHPASVLYSPENKEMFREGIRNFTKKVKLLGGFN